MIGFVVALYSEAELLLNTLDNVEEFYIADKKAYSFNIYNQHAVLVISGIGKVSAALSTQLLIDKYTPDFIVNFGTCGGMDNKVEILKYYAVDKCCQFDFDLKELDGVPLGYIQEYKSVYFYPSLSGLEFLEKASLASADRFTNAKNDIDAIVNEVKCSLRDMEGGAIGQVCTSNNVPLFMIKGVTDVYGSGTAQEQFYKNLKQVGAGFPQIIIKAVESIIKTRGL